MLVARMRVTVGCVLGWGFLCGLVSAPSAWGVLASPNAFETTQPDGTVIQLKVRGDEFFHWWEDLDGFSVVRDDAGRYVYAERSSGGRLAATAFEVGQVDPKMLNIPRGLLPSSSFIRDIRAQKSRQMNLPLEPQKPAETARGTGGQPTILKNLVICAVFNDHYDSADPSVILEHTRPAAEYQVLFNQTGGDPVLAPTGSVRDFYWFNSGGQLRLDSQVSAQPKPHGGYEPIWVKLPESEAFYAENFQQMTIDALDRVDLLMDLSLFDENEDGMIDAVTIVHSGYGAEAGGSGVWSHMGTLPVTWTSREGVSVNRYCTGPALWSTAGTEISRIGVFSHELGHLVLGLPDLYDTFLTGEGVGSFGIMGNSWGFDGSQLTLPHFCAWSRIWAGWIEPVVINDPNVADPWGVYEVPDWQSYVLHTAPEDSHPVYRVDLRGGFLVTPIEDPNVSLVDILLGTGITVQNIVYTGEPSAVAFFRGGLKTGIGIETGIIMTTGTALDARAPNEMDGTTTMHGLPGDFDLEIATGQDPCSTYDACALEFDFTTAGGDLYFNFVFASEEYNEFVYSFNDVFAFLLDGVNIAMIPGTDPPVPIGVDFVNGGNPYASGNESFSEYYNNNDPSDGGPFFNIEYDGFTDVFTATALDLAPGSHHLKLVIADKGDMALDSAVMIQAGSLSDSIPDNIPEPPTEYLLIENRQPTGFETAMPQGGLAIWYIDDESLGSYANNDVNGWEGYPGQHGLWPEAFWPEDVDGSLWPPDFCDDDKWLLVNPDGPKDQSWNWIMWPYNGYHYRVALLQADGRYDLEHGNPHFECVPAGNRGDGGDLFHAEGTHFINRCGIDNPDYPAIPYYPNTNTYQYGNVAETDVSISAISPAAPLMHFTFRDRAYHSDDYPRAIPVEMGTWVEPIQGWVLESYMNEPLTTECGYGSQGYTSTCAGFDPVDAWYTFSPVETDSYTVNCCGLSETFDVTLEVMSEPNAMEDPSKVLACNDDTEAENQCFYQAAVNFHGEAGETYYIRIAGYNSEVGEYIMTVAKTAAPGHDDCNEPIVIESGVPYIGNSTGATQTLPCNPGHNLGDNLDVWHTFTATRTGLAVFSMCGSYLDTTLGVYADQCPDLAGSLLAFNRDCSDDPDNDCGECEPDTYSRLVVPLVEGESYLLRVAGVNHAWGEYVLTVYEQPVNDDCDQAIRVKDYAGSGQAYAGITLAATPTLTSDLENLTTSCGGGNDIRDVWYSYKPRQSGNVTVSLCGSGFDTTLAVYDACGGTQLACNDDSIACDYGQQPQSQLTLMMQAEQLYYIRIAGFDGQTGEYILKVIGGSGTDFYIREPWQFDWQYGVPVEGCLNVFGGTPPYLWTLLNPPSAYRLLDDSAYQAAGSAQNWHGEEVLWQYSLPFAFPFYGQDYTAVYVSSNGFLDFDPAASADWNNSEALLRQNVRIAPLWDDLTTVDACYDVYVAQTDDYVTFRWEAGYWPDPTGTTVCHFAATLYKDGRIRFDYGPDNDQITPTVGISAGNDADYLLVDGYDGADSLTGADSVMLAGPLLPPGVEYDPASGCFTGEPQAIGWYYPVAEVTDSSGESFTEQKQCQIRVLVPGDINRDYQVDMTDYSTLAQYWGAQDCASPDWCEQADANHDGRVDLYDLKLMMDYWMYWIVP